MRTYEHQGKEIFASYGIPTPQGKVAETPEEAAKVAGEINGPVIVKAQVHIGGRGKAGGVKPAKDPDEAREVAEQILGMDIKGYTVNKVLVEEQLDIAEEYYLGFTLDRGTGLPVAIMSSMGGVNIEEVARDHPDRIAKRLVDTQWGFHDYQVRGLIFNSGINLDVSGDVIRVFKSLWTVFQERDATLAEINPLIVTTSGDVIAGDAKFTADDNALYRHPDLAELAESDKEDPLEKRAYAEDIEYVRLGGTVGVLGNGAGLVMGTLDSIDLEGGKPANFLDVGGGAKAEEVASALSLVLSDENVRSVLFNIFGGITRCDEVARGILQAVEDVQPEVPVVVRLAGTNEEEGRALIKDSDLHIVETMEEAAKKAVALVEDS